MLSAGQARKLSEGYQSAIVENELRRTGAAINEAAGQGKTSVCLDGTLSKPTEQILKSLGYTIERGSQYNQSYFLISW